MILIGFILFYQYHFVGLGIILNEAKSKNCHFVCYCRYFVHFFSGLSQMGSFVIRLKS